MSKIIASLLVSVCLVGVAPHHVFAARTRTLTGVVTSIGVSGVTFKNSSAATYSVDFAQSELIRKNGSPMGIADMIVGDRISVSGTVWGDNSISATKVMDLSLFAHTGSFSGKIVSLDPAAGIITLETKSLKTQKIQTNALTSYKENGLTSTFQDLQPGMGVTITGTWERPNAGVVAQKVASTLRFINIYFTGTISMVNGYGLTVIGNGNVIYGVDATSATLLSKSGKAIALSQISVGQIVHVWGKHIAGTVEVKASKVKNGSF